MVRPGGWGLRPSKLRFSQQFSAWRGERLTVKGRSLPSLPETTGLTRHPCQAAAGGNKPWKRVRPRQPFVGRGSGLLVEKQRKVIRNAAAQFVQDARQGRSIPAAPQRRSIPAARKRAPPRRLVAGRRSARGRSASVRSPVLRTGRRVASVGSGRRGRGLHASPNACGASAGCDFCEAHPRCPTTFGFRESSRSRSASISRSTER
jgi:hypothetical protein